MENKVYGRIYLITNLVNRKQYVGKTVRTIKKRFKDHCKNAKYQKTYIGNAINKYKKENFKIEEIALSYTKEQLKFSEGFYIKSFNTLVPNGYNLTDIINGQGKLSKETKEKMSKSARKPKNLKIASENGIKTRGNKYGIKSKYRGVCFSKNKYYKSEITINNKKEYLGSYNSEIDAAKIYDIAAIKYFGNDATLNFPELRRDYIENKITINKNTSKSGIKGIRFEQKRNQYYYIWFNKSLNKNNCKYFKTLEEAIKFKSQNRLS